MGRKKTLAPYSQGLMNTICYHIAFDSMTLKEVCRKYKDDIPDESTIYRWKRQYKECRDLLREAYETYFYRLIDEVEELSKEPPPENPNKVFVHAEMNRRRMRIDTIKFILAKIAPKFVHDLRDVAENVQKPLPQITIVNYTDSKRTSVIEPLAIEAKTVHKASD